MAIQDIDVTATTSAPAHAVHALLRDGATWPTWSPLGSFELERPAEHPDGVGEIRIFRTGRIRNREQVVESVPGRRLSYVLLEGMAIRDYRADIDLTDTENGGTVIRWHSTFRAKVPGMGGIYRRSLTSFLQQCVDGLADHAARISSPGAPAD